MTRVAVETSVAPAAFAEPAAPARQRRPPPQTFGGLRVLCLESRREPELALLVMNYGGRPVVAAALREVPLESNTEAIAFGGTIMRAGFDMLVLLTGVGTRALIDVASPTYGREAFVAALGRTRIAARGPKPVAALREHGLSAWITAPKPNTWRELLAVLDAHAGEVPLDGLRLGVQEYGLPNADLEDALVERGAHVTTVPIYRWAIPDDRRPLRGAVLALLDGAIDVVALTTGVQLVHLLRVAGEMGVEQAAREALAQAVIASIGPMTTEEVLRQGLTPDLEATNSKMGYLVKEAAEQSAAILRTKRATVR